MKHLILFISFLFICTQTIMAQGYCAPKVNNVEYTTLEISTKLNVEKNIAVNPQEVDLTKEKVMNNHTTASPYEGDLVSKEEYTNVPNKYKNKYKAKKSQGLSAVTFSKAEPVTEIKKHEDALVKK